MPQEEDGAHTPSRVQTLRMIACSAGHHWPGEGGWLVAINGLVSGLVLTPALLLCLCVSACAEVREQPEEGVTHRQHHHAVERQVRGCERPQAWAAAAAGRGTLHPSRVS